MVDRKANPFAKDANYAGDSNRLWDRMNRRGDVDCLLDMELSNSRKKQNCGVGGTKIDMDDEDPFDENYLEYLLELETSVKPKPVPVQKSVKMEPIKGHEADPEYVMFLEFFKGHGIVPIEEDVTDPQYLMFLENLKEHGNSYMVDVPLEHGGPLRIIYEEVMKRKNARKTSRRPSGVHTTHTKRNRGESSKREFLCSSSDEYLQEERNNAKTTGRRLGGVHTTHIKRNRGESTKRKFLCPSSDEYLQEERNIAEKNERNASSYGVRNTLKKRTCCENRRKNSHSRSHLHVKEKRNNFLKNNNRRNVRFYELNYTEERIQSESTKGKNSCSSSDSYAQAEMYIAGKNNRRNVRSYGVSNTLKKETCGESMEGKISHSTSHVYVQEKRNIAVKNNERNVGSYGVNSAQKARTCGKGMKRNNSYSSSNGCYVLDVIISDSSEANTSNLKDSDFCNRMAVSLDRDVQEKRTVGEVIKKRKLMTHTGNHFQEERNLNVSNGKKSGVEGSGSTKIITKPHSSDHFQGKQTTKKNNPISVSFADFQDKERTDEKNPNPLNLDYLKEDQCINVQEKRTVGTVIKKRKLMSHTGNHIQEERNLNISNGKKSGVDGSGFSKIITKPHSSDHFQGKQTKEKNNPISVSFADFQDKERTEEKNSIPLTLDYFKEVQCVNVPINSRSAPKNSSFKKSVVNEVYDSFLKNLKVIGESVVYKFGDNERVLYEVSSKRRVTIVADSGNPPIGSDQPKKNNLRASIAAESSDQSTRKIVAGVPLTVPVATEKQPTHPSTSFIPASRSTMPLSGQQLYNSLEVPHRVPTNLRKKLLVILNRPYSEQEHEQLWKEVSFRSAVLTHRDSRSGGSHRPGQMGRSLLDWNPDLSSEIEKVKSDPVKVLNLLRMLSFYLKKLACGNICKPWMDDSLMTIIHGSA